MDRLAKETFIYIMSHLDLNDKINCILVCRNWYNILVSTNLYSHITIGHDERKFYDAIEHIGKSETTRMQIIDLDFIRHQRHSSFAAFSLPRLFPNVKFLQWRDDKGSYTDIVYPSRLLKMDLQNWSKLRSIDNNMGDTYNRHIPLTICLLGSAVWNNLTRLSISFNLDDSSRTEPSLKTNGTVQALIANLKNAPNLEYLCLKYLKLGIYDLEIIHSSVRKLKKLALKSVYINASTIDHSISINQQMKIEYADSVESLEINFDISDETFEDDTQLLQWLTYTSNRRNKEFSLVLSYQF